MGCEPTELIVDAAIADAMPDAEILDMGPPDAMPDLYLPPIESTTLSGTVRLGAGLGAGVQVTVGCDDLYQEGTTDGMGNYALDVHAGPCPFMRLTFKHPGHIPLTRVIPQPFPSETLENHVTLEPAVALTCDDAVCESGPLYEPLPADQIREGWVFYDNGRTVTEQLPGPFVTSTGDLLWVTAYAYHDVYDGEGERIESMPPFAQCIQVSEQVFDRLVDSEPATTSRVEINRFTFDEREAVWRQSGQGGTLQSRPGPNDPFAPLSAQELGAIRRGESPSVPWICDTFTGSGLVAYGRTIRPGGCVAVQVVDQSDRAVDGVAVEVLSHAEGFLTRAWTDQRGQACLTTAASEPADVDEDSDGLSGEIHMVDVMLRGPSQGTARVDGQSLPSESGTCDTPERCIQVRESFFISRDSRR
ncbi:MAG: hypothetical protein ACE366_29605 [Bradymonadia bacterium]